MLSKEQMLQALTSLGFRPNEAQVYLTVLELKEALPGTVARRSKLKRSTIYLLLEGLEQKGLLQKVRKNGNIVFKAGSPESFIAQEQKKSEVLQSSLKALSFSLPKLFATYAAELCPSEITIFKGEKGVEKILSELGRDRKMLLSWDENGKRQKGIIGVFNIYRDKVAIVSLKDELGVLIQNEHIAKAQRAVFENIG
ncbi:MAG: helix-turn-helix domain-containing protein [Candidatus Gracilibacteria bacterium]|jgi:sugar-specific transcriptional regulator TrmB